MCGNAGRRAQSSSRLPSLSATASSSPAAPSLQNASVSNRTAIAFGIQEDASEKRSVGFARRFDVDVPVEEIPKRPTAADVSIEGLQRQLTFRKFLGSVRVRPQQHARIDLRFSFPSACFVCERPEIDAAQFRESTATPEKRPREQLGDWLNTRGIGFGDVVFLVDDGSVRSAVPMSDVASFVGRMDEQPSGLVIRMA